MSKRRRVLADLPPDILPNVMHQGGVSMTGLAKLLATLQGTDPASVTWNRAVLGQANSEMFHRIKCADELRMLGGDSWTWIYVDPFKLLTILMAESVALQASYEEAWARSPASPQTPWSLLVAFDEFVPGNKLATDQTRKSMVVSFTFLELGGAALAKGKLWCTPVIVRSAMIAKVILQFKCS
jgi:hypothetical protein